MKIKLLLFSLLLSFNTYSQTKTLISSGKDIPALYVSITERRNTSVVILLSLKTDFYGNFSETPIVIKLDNNEIIKLYYCGNAFPTQNNAGALFLIPTKTIEKLKKHKVKAIKITLYGATLFYKNIIEPKYFMDILRT